VHAFEQLAAAQAWGVSQVHAPAKANDTAAKRVTLFQQVQDTLSALPGVQSTSAINHLPIGGDIWAFGYDVVGRPASPPGHEFAAVYRVIRTGYFETMQIPLLRGRDITAPDDDHFPAVVVLNEALARQQWPGEDPVGRQILLREPNQEPLRMTIVGVAKNSPASIHAWKRIHCGALGSLQATLCLSSW
jgi:hypothetical protein